MLTALTEETELIHCALRGEGGGGGGLTHRNLMTFYIGTFSIANDAKQRNNRIRCIGIFFPPVRHT